MPDKKIPVDALDFELNKVRNRFSWVFEKLLRLAKGNTQHRELIKRVLVASDGVLFDTLGSLDEEFGYSCQWDSGPLSRMEFIGHFIGHELLDDGDPALGWHKYHADKGVYVSCSKDERGAKPFWHNSREVLQQTNPETPPLYEEEALWVLAWHEDKELKTRRICKKHGMVYSTEEWPDPMLVKLADKF